MKYCDPKTTRRFGYKVAHTLAVWQERMEAMKLIREKAKEVRKEIEAVDLCDFEQGQFCAVFKYPSGEKRKVLGYTRIGDTITVHPNIMGFLIGAIEDNVIEDGEKIEITSLPFSSVSEIEYDYEKSTAMYITEIKHGRA